MPSAGFDLRVVPLLWATTALLLLGAALLLWLCAVPALAGVIALDAGTRSVEAWPALRLRLRLAHLRLQLGQLPAQFVDGY